jgi:xanthine dehydrogenase molybdopterin-binding subunit B
MAARARGAVGRNVLRKEGVEKVTGAARYVDDLTFPGLLHARTIRSTIPCGEIAGTTLAFDTAGFTIVDHRDVPGRNIVALIDDDQPCLAERRIRHVAEPILLLAHADRERLLAADVRITYRDEPPHYDPETSPLTFKTIAIEKGDLAAGFAAADLVVEGEYRTGHQEQLYIEPNGVIAVPHEDGGVTVYGSMQCPYYVHRALVVLMGLPGHQVRVIQTETGGGFGGKEEYPSMIAGHAALLARKSGRPVKLVYDRVEDMLATTKRHPAIVRHIETFFGKRKRPMPASTRVQALVPQGATVLENHYGTAPGLATTAHRRGGRRSIGRWSPPRAASVWTVTAKFSALSAAPSTSTCSALNEAPGRLSRPVGGASGGAAGSGWRVAARKCSWSGWAT